MEQEPAADGRQSSKKVLIKLKLTDGYCPTSSRAFRPVLSGRRRWFELTVDFHLLDGGGSDELVGGHFARVRAFRAQVHSIQEDVRRIRTMQLIHWLDSILTMIFGHRLKS